MTITEKSRKSVSNFTSFADGNTPHSYLSDMITVLGQLKEALINI